MTLIIELAKIKNSLYEALVPFWFTNDRAIYLNAESPRVEISNPEELDFNQLAGIKAGCDRKDIVVNNYKWVLDRLEELSEKPKPIEVPAPSREFADQEAQKKIKESNYKKEALEIISKSAADIANIVGPAIAEDDAILDGIFDVKLLAEILEAEKAKDKPRKTVVELVSARIALIEENDIQKNNQ